MTAPVVVAPSSTPYRRATSRRSNYEMYSWLFMRLSGAVLVVLVIGHLFVNLMVGDGISALDFGFVAGKWASPFWQVWDLAMLWLAMIHGSNGVRTIINDYAERDMTRIVLKTFVAVALVFTIVLGTLVIFTFEPCPVGADGTLLPAAAEFCSA